MCFKLLFCKNWLGGERFLVTCCRPRWSEMKLWGQSVVCVYGLVLVGLLLFDATCMTCLQAFTSGRSVREHTSVDWGRRILWLRAMSRHRLSLWWDCDTFSTLLLLLLLLSLLWQPNSSSRQMSPRFMKSDTVGDFTFWLNFRWAKVRSKYLLKPKSEVISLSESLTCKSMV